MAAKHRFFRDAQFRFFISLAFLFALASGAFPQDAAGTAGSSVGYYSETDEKGALVFTQILSWAGDVNALRFEVSIKDADGDGIFHEFTEDTSLKIRLVPGVYSYNIVTWNLLNQGEIESGWLPLTVIKAEWPSLTDVSPTFLYMDSLNSRVTLKGTKLLPGGRMYLRDSSGSEIEGKEQSRSDDTEVDIVFPDKAYRPGEFDIAFVNPGGLTAVQKNALRIRFQRPVDILFSVGYAPVSFMTDSWFKNNWSDSVYWLGADTALSVYFVKKSWGFVGAEASLSFHRLIGGSKVAVLTSDYYLSAGKLLYKYRFTRALHGVVRAGGGVSSSTHSFDYKGFSGPVTSSKDVCIDAGLSLQYFLPHKIFCELGADWFSIFEKDHTVGGIQPSLKIGYQLF